MINHYKRIVVIILCLVILILFSFGLFSYSKVSDKLDNNNRVLKREFYGGVNEIYFLENIDSLSEKEWDSICSAVDINCFILDNFEFTILFENNRIDEFDKIEMAVNNYFHSLNDILSNSAFYDLTLEQKRDLECIGRQIHSALGNGDNNFFPSLYSYIA